MGVIDLRNVKLIIWDLDETLWSGTLSEGEVQLIPKNEEFIKKTLDAGIVHSICSKNNFEQTEKELKRLGLRECFVFPSIDWTSKGSRVKNIIDEMGLRYINILFIDDNQQNLREVEYYCPGIMTALPDELPLLYSQSEQLPVSDVEHKRLEQYRVLEKKSNAKRSFSSNEEFLKTCDIHVEIKHDVSEQFDRLHELVMRTNQLNYTKNRSSKEELSELLSDPEVNAGYVTVRDKLGDYGIVGFFAIKEDKAVHYCYSCRTLGMLVEQWVYVQLGCPLIEVVPEVVTELNTTFLPPWINQKESLSCKQEKLGTSHRILIKGPCDMDQMFSFIKQTPNIVTEFSYTADNGAYIIGVNHTAQIVTAMEADDERKCEIVADSPWFDKGMLQTRLNSEAFECVIISLLADSVLGVYRRKATGELIALAEGCYDLTDPANWDKYIKEEIYTGKVKFTRDSLAAFSEQYEFVDNTDAHVTIDSLDKIYRKVGTTTRIVLVLGSEIAHENNQKISYVGKEKYHALMNSRIREWKDGKSNVVLVELSNYIQSQDDYMDTINHFAKRVYFDLAKDFVKILDTDSRMKNGIERATDKLRRIYRLVIRAIKR